MKQKIGRNGITIDFNNNYNLTINGNVKNNLQINKDKSSLITLNYPNSNKTTIEIFWIPKVEVTTPVTLTGTQNSAITDLQLVAIVSDGGTPTFTSTDLPEGLTLSSTGLISGTPTISGTGTSNITVLYPSITGKSITLNWNIDVAFQSDIIVISGFTDDNSELNGEYTIQRESETSFTASRVINNIEYVVVGIINENDDIEDALNNIGFNTTPYTLISESDTDRASLFGEWTDGSNKIMVSRN